MTSRPMLSLSRLVRRPAPWRGERAAALGELGPLLLLVLLIGASWWAIGEHARYKGELRFAETRRYLVEFTEPPVGPAWHRLSHAWQAELPRQEDLLAQVRAATGGGLHAPLHAYRNFVLATVESYALAPDVQAVLQYFRRLALCVRMGSCDAEVVAAAFGDLPWRFRNQHYLYLRETYPEENLDRIFRLITGGGPGAAPERAAPAEGGDQARWSDSLRGPGDG